MRKLALALLAACSGNTHTKVTVVDAPIDTTPDVAVPPTTVQLQVFGSTAPSLVAYRDGAGAWQTPTPDSSGNYTLTVSVDYQVVVACTDSTGSYAQLLEATAQDGAHQFVFCNNAGTPPTTVAMTGHMLQAGSVWFGDTATSTTAPWDFTLNVTPGTHDLIATSSANEMVIRRDQAVTAAGTIPQIDAATEGTAMTPVTLTINNKPAGEQLMTGLDFFTMNGSESLSWSSASIFAPPTSLVTANDFEILFVEAFDQTGAQFADVEFTGTETTFDLPPALTGVVFGPGKASFSTLPVYDDLDLDLQQHGTVVVEQQVHATKSWIDATHATSLAFDAMPPGFDAAWTVDTSTSYQRMFETAYTSNNITYSSMAYDTAAFQRGAKRPWFSTVDRLRESIRSQHTMPRR